MRGVERRGEERERRGEEGRGGEGRGGGTLVSLANLVKHGLHSRPRRTETKGDPLKGEATGS